MKVLLFIVMWHIPIGHDESIKIRRWTEKQSKTNLGFCTLQWTTEGTWIYYFM